MARLAQVVALLAITLLSGAAPQAHRVSEVRLAILAPDAAIGTMVRIKFAVGPDSLRGTPRTYAAPCHFTVPATDLLLLAERVDHHGQVRVSVEHWTDGVRGETGTATGDRVRVEVAAGRLQVRTVPRAMEL